MLDLTFFGPRRFCLRALRLRGPRSARSQRARWGDDGGCVSSPTSCGWAAWRSGRRAQPASPSPRRPSRPGPSRRRNRSGPQRRALKAGSQCPSTGRRASRRPAASAGEDSRTCSEGRWAGGTGGNLGLAAFHPTPSQNSVLAARAEAPSTSRPRRLPEAPPPFPQQFGRQKKKNTKKTSLGGLGSGWVGGPRVRIAERLQSPPCGDKFLAEGALEAAPRRGWASLPAPHRRGRNSRAFCLRTCAGLTAHSNHQAERSTFRLAILDMSGPK